MRVITRLKAIGANAARIEVELDDAAWAVIDTEVVIKRELAKGRILSDAECESLLKEDAFVRARRIGAGLLNTRPRAIAELRRRLREYRPAPPRKRRRRRTERQQEETFTPVYEKWDPPRFDEETVEAVIAHFTETGALDDADFARRYIRHYRKVKTVGPLKLRADLAQLGVAPPIVDTALAEETGGDEETQRQMIRRFIRRRIDRLKKDPPPRRRAKLQAALQRAGFDPGVFRPLLDEALGGDWDEDIEE